MGSAPMAGGAGAMESKHMGQMVAAMSDEDYQVMASTLDANMRGMMDGLRRRLRPADPNPQVRQ